VIALAVVRGGALPAGADEAAAEAGGSILLVGEGTRIGAGDLRAAAEVWCAELGVFAPGRWAPALAAWLRDHDVVVLPASPDGRDLAPRLAHASGRPLLAGAIAVTTTEAVLGRGGGLLTERHAVTGPVVVTLEPGVRGIDPRGPPPRVAAVTIELGDPPETPDAEVVEVVPPDPATMDLADARRIVAGGAGLGSADAFTLMAQVADALGASPGASRVAADLGWVTQDRFIGTTGVVVDPDLYVALGISGAVQHVSGLGDPGHIVAVNTDASAPMMTMADLAVVTDAPALLRELAARLGSGSGGPEAAS
jgi:electron transfer flavoprotein alpha subunit